MLIRAVIYDSQHTNGQEVLCLWYWIFGSVLQFQWAGIKQKQESQLPQLDRVSAFVKYFGRELGRGRSC